MIGVYDVEFIVVILGYFLLFYVIFSAVKNGIDKSEVGKLLIKKYGEKKEEVSDEEIEKEFDDRF